MRIASVIVSAGEGRRFGRKKQFEKITQDRIVLDYSVEKLSRYGEVVVVSKREDMDFIRKRYNVKVVEGGKERKNSVLNGLLALSGCDIVLIHDAVRPVMIGLDIDRLIKEALEFGAAIFYVPVNDTVKLKSDEFSTATLDRTKLALSQTPQAFDFKRLVNIMKKYVDEVEFTDEAALWEKFYGKVKLVEGSKRNIKITTKEDLEIVKCLLE